MGQSKKQETRTFLTEPLKGASVNTLNYGVDVFNKYRGADLPSTYTGISPEREQALQMMGAGGQAYAPAYDEWNKTISGGYLDPTTNPYFDRMVNTAMGKAQAGVKGQFGSYGMGGASSLSGHMTMDVGADTAARLYGNIYDQERGRMQNAVGQAPMMDQLQYADARRSGQVGLERERDMSAQQAEEMRQFEYPLRLLQQEQSFLGSSPLMNERVQSQHVPFDWLSMIGGLAGSLMPSPSSMFGGGGGP